MYSGLDEKAAVRDGWLVSFQPSAISIQPAHIKPNRAIAWADGFAFIPGPEQRQRQAAKTAPSAPQRLSRD